jgi:hypothetical protein
MSQCVFCEAVENLNTQMSVTLEDGTKVTVVICDVHAEDATVKTARNAYLDKKKKIDALLEQAKALGLNLSGFVQQGNLLVPAAKPAAPVIQEQAVPSRQMAVEELSGENVISTEIIDSRPGMQSVGGSTDFGNVAAHQSLDPNSFSSKLPAGARKGRAKMVTVEGREGMPISIPETRVDGTGTTHIRIVKKENNLSLQSRFKKMADDSIIRDSPPNFAREGYQNTQTTCPICRGDCSIRQGSKSVVCPKCGGLGFLPT